MSRDRGEKRGRGDVFSRLTRLGDEPLNDLPPDLKARISRADDDARNDPAPPRWDGGSSREQLQRHDDEQEEMRGRKRQAIVWSPGEPSAATTTDRATTTETVKRKDDREGERAKPHKEKEKDRDRHRSRDGERSPKEKKSHKDKSKDKDRDKERGEANTGEAARDKDRDRRKEGRGKDKERRSKEDTRPDTDVVMQVEQEQVEQARMEQERSAAAAAAAATERAAKERAEREQAEREQFEREQAERERTERQQAEQERAARERAERERLDLERAEQQQRAERQWLDSEHAAAERAAAVRLVDRPQDLSPEPRRWSTRERAGRDDDQDRQLRDRGAYDWAPGFDRDAHSQPRLDSRSQGRAPGQEQMEGSGEGRLDCRQRERGAGGDRDVEGREPSSRSDSRPREREQGGRDRDRDHESDRDRKRDHDYRGSERPRGDRSVDDHERDSQRSAGGDSTDDQRPPHLRGTGDGGSSGRPYGEREDSEHGGLVVDAPPPRGDFGEDRSPVGYSGYRGRGRGRFGRGDFGGRGEFGGRGDYRYRGRGRGRGRGWGGEYFDEGSEDRSPTMGGMGGPPPPPPGRPPPPPFGRPSGVSEDGGPPGRFAARDAELAPPQLPPRFEGTRPLGIPPHGLSLMPNAAMGMGVAEPPAFKHQKANIKRLRRQLELLPVSETLAGPELFDDYIKLLGQAGLDAQARQLGEASTGKAPNKATASKTRMAAKLAAATAKFKSLYMANVLLPMDDALPPPPVAPLSDGAFTEVHVQGLRQCAALLDHLQEQPWCKQSRSGMFLLTAPQQGIL